MAAGARATQRSCAYRVEGAPLPVEPAMNGIVYLVGLVVIVIAILSLVGLR